MHKILLSVFSLLVIAGCSTQRCDCPSQLAQPDYKINTIIEVGNILQVTVFNEPDLSGEYLVLTDGSIQIPLIDTIAIDGMELNKAAYLIADSFRSQGYLINPKVKLSMPHSQKFETLNKNAYADNIRHLSHECF